MLTERVAMKANREHPRRRNIRVAGEVLETPQRTAAENRQRRQKLLAKLTQLRTEEARWMRRLKSAFTRLTNIQDKAKRLEKTLHQMEE